jgi:glycosyltransferase involved in cell wall biosynthesis
VEVRFAGWLASAQKTEAMRQADLLAVPSLWPEPFGLVGIEAGCFALPAVGYATGGIPDWLIGGRTGEIAPGDPPTIHGLADALVRALGDRDHYAELCRGAWELSCGFSLERHLAKLEPILREACLANASAVHGVTGQVALS